MVEKKYTKKDLEKYAEESLRNFLREREPDLDLLKKQIQAVQVNDIVGMYNVNYDILKILNEDVQNRILYFSAKKGNLFSMKRYAETYMNQDFPHESKPEYEFWLVKAAGDDLVRKYIECRKNNECMAGISDNAKEHLQDLAAGVCFELGMYYRYKEEKNGAETLENLHKARNYIEDAAACGFFSDYFYSYKEEDILAGIDEQIKKLVDPEYNQRLMQEQLDLFEGIEGGLSIDEQIGCIKKRLIEITTEEIWNRFEKETRDCLVTAAVCYYLLMPATGESGIDLDYSCVVIPLMKCIEYELRKRFYDGYVDYLKKRFDVDFFFEYNGIDPDDKNDIKKRGDFIYWVGDKYEFKKTIKSSDFTLGSFVHVTGIKSVFRLLRGSFALYADNTMLDYCEYILFRKKDSDGNYIDHWLFNMAMMIQELQTVRNESAHGGNIITAYTAKETLKVMILTKKILVQLLNVCN